MAYLEPDFNPGTIVTKDEWQKLQKLRNQYVQILFKYSKVILVFLLIIKLLTEKNNVCFS